MSGNDAARFFDTSGCLNLTRPTTGTPTKLSQRKRPTSGSIPTRGQLKIDLYNFDHIDFCDSKYVLTSPRSLEACARLNIKPVTLLPKRLADVQDDIGTEKVRLATLADVRDQMEIDRLANLQRCREEREKIIREEALANPSSAKIPEPQPSSVHKIFMPPPAYVETKFTPSSSLLHGLNQPVSVSSVLPRSASASNVKFSQYDTHAQLPPRSTSSTRPTVANSILKSSTTQWSPPYEIDNQNEFHASSTASFNDDVRRMNKSLQRMSTSDHGSRENKTERYINGLENVKQMIERRATQSATVTDPETAAFEKKQYEILLGHYDHELKIQKARENARRNEKMKEIERYETLIHDLTDQSMAEERRRNELRRKINNLHRSRQLYETLQSKNYEQQLSDLNQRRFELLQNIKQKDRRTRHFNKDKEYSMNLSRSLAKSSQDLRDYLRETHENFDEMARKAEFTSNVLVKKPKVPVQRRHLQSSIRT